MAKERPFDLPQTTGKFQIAGIVTGMAKDTAYSEGQTKNGGGRRTLNFGVEYDSGCTNYLRINAFTKPDVYFYSSKDKKTEKVSWNQRNTFSKEGYRMLGINCGIEKTVDDKGNMKNDNRMLDPYDAAEYCSKKLTDGEAVFVRGALEYSSSNGNDGIRVYKNFTPNQISLSSADMYDFSSPSFKAKSNFQQQFVFMGIEQEKDDKEKTTGRFVVSGKVVTYNDIIDIEMIVDADHSKLAGNLKKKVKPYTSLIASGNIVSSTGSESVEVDDEWGDVDEMEVVSTPRKTEMIITGVHADSFDTETYSKKLLDSAITSLANSKKADENFNAGASSDSDEWGDVSLDETDDDVDW